MSYADQIPQTIEEEHCYGLPHLTEFCMLCRAAKADDSSSVWVDPEHRKSKTQYPYSYSEFFIFGSRAIIAASNVSAVYSDRIWEWDHRKANDLSNKILGFRTFRNAGQAILSKFISEFYGISANVVALAEGCNQATGYPYFIVWYTTN